MLFRQNATNAIADRLHGEVLVLPKLPHLALLSFLLFWVILVAIWLVTSSFPRKATAQGWLEPKAGIAKIYADRPSKVANIMIREGQNVTKGQPLIEIHDLHAFTEGSSIKDQLETEIEAERARIKNQFERQETYLRLRTDQLLSNLSAARENLHILNQQKENIIKRRDIFNKQYQRAISLVNDKYISRENFEQVSLNQLDIDFQYDSLTERILTKNIEIDEYDHNIYVLNEEHKNTIDRLNSELSDLTTNQTQLSNQYVTIINAPKTGVVTNLQTTVGQQLRANELLLNISDSAMDLEIVLLMPVTAAGFIESGQELQVRYDPFPHEKFGLYSAAVTKVSSTVLLPDELSSSPIRVNTPVYKLKARANSQTISAFGKQFPLKPGMTLSADITLENRSLLAWLLEPIFSVRGQL